MIKGISNITSNSVRKVSKKSLSSLGVVSDVILDQDSNLIPQIETDEDFTDDETTYIGAVRVSRISDGVVNKENFDFAFPHDRNIIRLPIKNEIVQLHDVGGTLYYSLIDSYFSPSITADINLLNTIINDSDFESVDPSKVNQYKNASRTGIPRSTTVDSDDEGTFGEYYEGDQNIHRLKLFEGDILWESRFGQSIRFNGYDGENSDMNPTIFIRNGENGISQSENKFGDTTVEDINRDGTSIVISSGSRIIDFTPGTLSSQSKTDFKTQPKSVNNYPQELDGDQVLVSSGRLIFSSRSDETLMFSKGNFGIISDKNFSLDLGGGIIGNVKGHIDIKTNDKNVTLKTGNGHVELGSDGLENMVLGETLVELMGDILDAIIQQTYATPSGPTSQGPINQTEFRRIKTQLNRILGKNKTN